MSYKTYLAMLSVSAFGAFWLTPFAAWLARRYGAMDLPDKRKVHSRPTPRMGGVAVYLGFLLPWAGLYLLHNPITEEFKNYEKLFFTLILGATAMLSLGVYDDIKGADATKKFLAQSTIAIGLWIGGYRIETFQNPLGGLIHLGWFGLPVTLIWIVGVTNAINLLDGIDGLVSGVTVCMAIALAVINALTGNVVVALLTVSLAGACLGFLPHNHSPAWIFLGDSGSLTIGGVLACVGIISLFRDNGQAASPLVSVPLILFGLPLFDTLRVMFKRWRRGASVFHADTSHVHPHLLSFGPKHRQASWLLYGVALVTGTSAVLLTTVGIGLQLQLSVLFALLGAGVAMLLKFWTRASSAKTGKHVD